MAQNYHHFQDSEASQNYVIGEACNQYQQPQQEQFNYPPLPFQNQSAPLPQQLPSVIPQHQQQQQQQQPQQFYYPAMQIPNSIVNPFPLPSGQNQPQSILQVQAQTMGSLIFYLSNCLIDFIIQNQPRSRFSEQLYCVNCKTFIPTEILYKPGLGAIIFGGVIALFGGWFGCCLIPCCLQDCKDAIHTCPKCGIEIGSRPFLTN